MRPEAVVERIWPGRAYTIEPLGGGITNHNFKVSFGDEAVVLRVAGTNTELLGIDREVEAAAARMAASVGVGPEVVEFVEPEGWLVTRFVEGEPVPPDRMREPANLRRVADALRTIHAAPVIPGRFDAHRVVEAYRETAAAHGVDAPAAFDWAKGVADRIEAARGPHPLVPCHNDLLNANFIDDGERLRIVDWEYAGMGDHFFDLANFSVNHELGEAQDRELLDAYAGAAAERDLASLRLMRFMSDFREAMWGVVQQGISELDVDFVGYAHEHFERLERTAESERFRGALAATA